MRPLLALDFEYNQSNEPHMGLVSVDYCSESGRQESIWLKDSPEGKAKAVRILNRIKDTHTLVSHAVTAEASCLLALGLNPREFEWFDTYLEYTQLQNANLKYKYGWHYRESLFTGGWTQSFPLYKASDLLELDEAFGEDREKFMERAKADGRNHEEVTPSLLHALKNILGIEIDVHQKNTTRALILERKPEYSEKEKAQILGYGASDTRHLVALARELKRLVGGRLEKIKPMQEAEVDRIILWRGRAAANVAVYTMTGIPISRSRLHNLVSQKRTVIHEAIRNFQATVYALWEFDRKDSEWHIKTVRCNAWAESLIAKYGMAWPKGAKGDYSMSTASGFPLDEYWGISDEIKAYRHVTELIKGLGYHATDEEAITRKAAGKRLFRDSLGSDDRVRPYYGPYGTQTGRNAPQATSFIFAQAGWLRGLVEPKPGHILGECLAEGTRVLTKSRGFTNIETITLADELWDGSQWARHGGLINKGVKDVKYNEGIWATGNHELVGEDGEWHRHDEMVRYRRYNLPQEACSWATVWSLAGAVTMAFVRKGLQTLGFTGGQPQ